MYVELHSSFQGDPKAQRASEIINACVHCGFCLSTCPTYLDSRDERDSPRGRIYLLKNLLEEGTAGPDSQHHLDRCLSCRSCETTCPSGVAYGELADIGRAQLEQATPRSSWQKLRRDALRFGLTRPRLFAAALALGRTVRPILPARLRAKIPPRQAAGALPNTLHKRQVLVLDGCIQSSATPRTNAAAARVLHKLGISVTTVTAARCCGAIDYHLGAQAAGLAQMRRNIDNWWPHIEAGAEAVIATATGCGATLADYGMLLADDPLYAKKAARITALNRDISQLLLAEDLSPLRFDNNIGPIAVHTPCSMQHALQLPGAVEKVLQRAGFSLAATRDKHLCCGSAGTYSLLQPAMSRRLLDNKLRALNGAHPALIATANIGCQLQLASAAEIPVVHWLELLDGHGSVAGQ